MFLSASGIGGTARQTIDRPLDQTSPRSVAFREHDNSRASQSTVFTSPRGSDSVRCRAPLRLRSSHFANTRDLAHLSFFVPRTRHWPLYAIVVLLRQHEVEVGWMTASALREQINRLRAKPDAEIWGERPPGFPVKFSFGNVPDGMSYGTQRAGLKKILEAKPDATLADFCRRAMELPAAEGDAISYDQAVYFYYTDHVFKSQPNDAVEPLSHSRTRALTRPPARVRDMVVDAPVANADTTCTTTVVAKPTRGRPIIWPATYRSALQRSSQGGSVSSLPLGVSQMPVPVPVRAFSLAPSSPPGSQVDVPHSTGVEVPRPVSPSLRFDLSSRSPAIVGALVTHEPARSQEVPFSPSRKRRKPLQPTRIAAAAQSPAPLIT